MLIREPEQNRMLKLERTKKKNPERTRNSTRLTTACGKCWVSGWATPLKVAMLNFFQTFQTHSPSEEWKLLNSVTLSLCSCESQDQALVISNKMYDLLKVQVTRFRFGGVEKHVWWTLRRNELEIPLLWSGKVSNIDKKKIILQKPPVLFLSHSVW